MSDRVNTAKLKRQRSSLSKLFTTVSEAKEITEEDLRVHRLKLESIETEITALNGWKLENIKDEDEEIELELNKQEEYSDKLIKIRAILQKYEESTSQKTESASSKSEIFLAPNVRLPKRELPKFGGDRLKFFEFWESFEIVDKSQLSDVEKFGYLRQCLFGKAALSIDGLSLTSTNYNHAKEILVSTFGQKNVIIASHVDALLKIPSASPNPLSLRDTYSKINQHLRSLESLGIHTKQFGVILAPIVSSKIPESVRLMIVRKSCIDDDMVLFDLDNLMSELLKEIRSLEISKINVNNAQEKSSSGPINRPYKPSASALHSAAKSNVFCTFCKGSHESARCHMSHQVPTASVLTTQTTFRKKCPYCNQDHSASACSAYSTVESRLDLLRKNGRCFICLKPRHLSKDCTLPYNCHKCGLRHHISVCSKTPGTSSSAATSGTRLLESQKQSASSSPKNSAVPTPPSATSQLDSSATFTGCSLPNKNGHPKVILQTAVAQMTNPNSRSDSAVQARILFDTGSQRSYCTSILAEKLGLQFKRKEKLSIFTFGSSEGTTSLLPVVELAVHSRDNKQIFVLECLVMDGLCKGVPTACDSRCVQVPAFASLDLAETETGQDSASVDVLVGIDCYSSLISSDRVCDPRYPGMVALNSPFGYVVFGIQHFGSDGHLSTVSSTTVNHTLADEASDDLGILVKQFYSLDSLGIGTETNQTDDDVFQNLKDTITREEDGRFIVRLPLKLDRNLVPSHRSICERRLATGYQKPGLRTKADAVIIQQLTDGIIEVVPDVSLPGHYMPHHSVLRNSPTTPVRIVHDGSFKCRKSDLSLNDCLHSGPDLLPNLLTLLVSFRNNRVAFTADIKGAFLQIGVHTEDRDLLRFLWNHNGSDITEYRFKRVPFGLNCGSFLLNATIKVLLGSEKENFPETCGLLDSYLYIDDFISGSDTMESSLRACVEAKEIFSRARMQLCKFTSNSCDLLKSLDADMEFGFANDTKVLGQGWTPSEDKFYFNFDELVEKATSLPITRRTVLKCTASIYDPLGFLSPITICAKLIFTSACSGDISWDEELDAVDRKKFTSWIEELKLMKKLRIPRYVLTGMMDSVELHGFADASIDAYAAVVYVVVPGQSNLILSKSRVAPKSLKKVSIPRLELLGCLILSRLVKKAFACYRSICSAIHLYTDSSAALFWITASKKWKVWVSNRVAEINENVSLPVGVTWHHIAGQDNIADLPSRGGSFKDLGEKWFNGPNFLFSIFDNQRFSKFECSSLSEEGDSWNFEKSQEDSNIIQSEIVAVSHVEECDSLIDYDRFSSFFKLVKTMSFVLKFVRLLKLKIGMADANINISYTNEIREAERIILRDVQKALPHEKKNLSKQLNLFCDEGGLMRCRGRLTWSGQTTFSANNPILIPKKHVVSNLIILEAHHSVLHSGVSQTLSQVRQRFWIIAGRQAVRSVLSKCITCLRFNGSSYGSVKPAALPDFRSSKCETFETVGLDFLGPIFVHDIDCAAEKRWIALFTCSATRAVHMEVSKSQSTSDVLDVIRNFVSRRGLPKLVVTDNASTFVKLGKYFASCRIEWKHIVEKAAWWGGFYERLVGMVKSNLKKVLGKKSVTSDNLCVLIHEIEAVINSRPLTYVGDDDVDILTPGHFLIGRSITTVPESTAAVRNVTDTNLREMIQLKTRMSNHFWNLWSREYLLSLREKWQKVNTNNSKSIRVGDICLVQEKNSRLLWSMGKVMELLPGRDGLIRAGVVKVKNSLLRRPVQHLYPLELSAPVPDYVCPGCGLPDDGKLKMIGCDGCNQWWHWDCCAIQSAPKEKLWYCANCR